MDKVCKCGHTEYQHRFYKVNITYAPYIFASACCVETCQCKKYEHGYVVYKVRS